MFVPEETKLATVSVSKDRLHHFDAARALFMLLGIPFHAALAYVPGGHWLVHSGQTSDFLGMVAFVTQSFRMPGFFLIAGFFSAFLLARRARGLWLQARLTRLGLPLLTAGLLLLPLQRAMLAYAQNGHVIDWQIFTLPWPHPLDYLWFLPCMMMLCVLLALSWPALCRLIDSRAMQRLLALPLIWPILGLLAGLWLVGMHLYALLFGAQPVFAMGFIHVEELLGNLPWFVAGILCQRSADVRASLERFQPINLTIGVAALIGYAMLEGTDSRAATASLEVLSGIAALCIVSSLFALLTRWAARPSPFVRKWVDASFTVYLFHHPIILALTLLSIANAVPPLIGWIGVSAAALALSFAMHRLISRSAVALWLFNGIPFQTPARRGVLADKPG